MVLKHTRTRLRNTRCRLLLEALEDRVTPSLTTGIFEIDGNAIDNTPGAGTGVSPAKLPAPDDWANIFKSLGSAPGSSDGPAAFDNAIARTFVADPAATDSTFFVGGGSKDINDVTQWRHTTTDVSPDKDDLTNAYAAGYIDPANNHGYIYFGSDRFDTSGSGQVGFWFFRSQVGLNANGTFSGAHTAGTVNFATHKVVTEGDILVLTDFTQGGTVPTIKVFMWVGGRTGDDDTALFGTSNNFQGNGPIQLLFDSSAAGTTDVNGDGLADVTAQVNTVTAVSPWPYTDKDGAHNFAVRSFFEGGIDLTSLGLGSGCISSFLAESRSSGSSTSAQLKDFALGTFDFCFFEVEGGTDTSKPTDTATYTMTVTNNGAQTIFLRNVTDVTGVNAGNTLLGTIVLNGVVQVAPAGETFSVPAGILDGLAPGETQTITVTRLTTAADLIHDPIITKTDVVFNSKADFTGDVLTHDPAVNTVDLFNPAVLITKSADKSAAQTGDTITYTFTITNKTDGDTTTAALDGTAPNLDLASISDSLLGDLTALATAAGLDHLTLNESGSFTAPFLVTAANYPGPLGNTVNVLYHPTGFPNNVTSSATNSVNLVDASIALSPATFTNEVNSPHTFTATVNQIVNGTSSPVPNGTAVVFTITDTKGTASTADDTTTTVNKTTTAGLATVDVNSAVATTLIINASTTISVQGVSLTRDTDPATVPVPGPGGTGPSTKVFVDASIALTPQLATNAVSTPHTVTATVLQNDGLPAGAPGDATTGFGPAPNGTVVLFVLTNSGSDAHFLDGIDNAGDGNPGGLDNDTLATVAGGAGQASVSFTSTTAGTVTINASTTFLVGGVSLTRDTDPATVAIPAGPGGSGPASKVFVDASIALTPQVAENPVLAPHTVTATVLQNDGLPAGAPGDATTGFGPAPDGTQVLFVLSNSGSDAHFLDGLDNAGDGNPGGLDNDTLALTVAGLASVTFTSSLPGTVTINAYTTFSVQGVSLTRDTDPATTAVAGPGGSGPASKVFVGFPDLHITKAATTLADVPITAPIAQGDQYKYVLHVANTGNAAAHVVTVNDDLDNRLTIISVTVNGVVTGYFADPADPLDPNHIIIGLPDLGPGGEATVVIVVDTGEPGDDCLFTTNFASVLTVDPETPASLHGGTPGESDNTSNTVIVSTTETLQTVLFDPDGNPLTNNSVDLAAFDPSPGNALAFGAIPGVLSGSGVDFRLIFQSTMSSLLGADGSPVFGFGGTNFQILTEANFMEHGAPIAANAVLFSNPLSALGPNMFRMIYRPISSPTDINNRTGAGFVFTDANNDNIDDNDGVSRLILQGHITDIFGAFVGTGTNSPRLDPTSGAPVAGPLNPVTRNFSGSTAVTVSIDFSNPLFFPDPTEQLTTLNFTTQNVTPFNSVGANISGTFFEGSTAALTGINGVDGTNALFQADANTSLTLVCVPLDEAGNPVAVDNNGVPLTSASSTRARDAVFAEMGGNDSGLTAVPPDEVLPGQRRGQRRR